MKAIRDFIIGLALAILGAFIFLSNVTVNGFYSGFFSMRGGMFHTGTTTMGILVVMMAAALFLTIIKPNLLSKILLFAFFILFIISIVLSLNFGFRSMNGFTLFAILALFIVGLGLIFKGLLGVNNKKDE